MYDIVNLEELEKLLDSMKGSYVKIEDDRGFKIKGTLKTIQPEMPYIEVLKANVVFPEPQCSRNRLQFDIDHFQFGFGSIQWVNFAKNGEIYTYKPVR